MCLLEQWLLVMKFGRRSRAEILFPTLMLDIRYALPQRLRRWEIYIRDKVAENAAKTDRNALERLRRDFEPLPCVGGVNGLGLMPGIEVVADKATKKPFGLKLNVMQKLQDQVLEKELFLRMADIRSTPNDRIVFAPPLVITTKEVDEALDILYPIVAGLKTN